MGELCLDVDDPRARVSPLEADGDWLEPPAISPGAATLATKLMRIVFTAFRAVLMSAHPLRVMLLRMANRFSPR